MVYDSARGVSVLFGGEQWGTYRGDTWEWDGSTWRRGGSGPSIRAGHGMAYDKLHGVTVLYGGEDEEFYPGLSDTWTWDGSQWRQIEASGPGRRSRGFMAYDSIRNVTVLFGGWKPSGVFGIAVGDTWEFDGSQWTLVAEDGPEPRSDGAMVFDEDRGVMVLFGGWGNSGPRPTDTWEWDGVHWTQEALTGPSGRTNPGMAYDLTRHVTVLFGGKNGSGKLGDTWEWDGSSWRQVGDTGPAPRHDFDLTYHPADESVYLFGGDADVQLGDTWKFSCAGSAGITLSAEASCPTGGPIQINWSDATPGGGAAILFARDTGAAIIPDGNPCAGTMLGLGTQLLQAAWRGRSDPLGGGTVNASAPALACGGHLQLLDVPTCTTSNIVQIE